MLYTYEKYYDASDGSSLITTIDSTVQAYVEKNLQNAIDKYDIKNGAFCIVMDVNTGEIKAMATLGSYDPNNYLEIYDDAAAALLENERDAALTLPELRERFARHRCRAWFSEDFYCQYATYRETEQLHLILYDNAASVQAKLDLAAELGLAGALVCWEEISGFQPPVW